MKWYVALFSANDYLLEDLIRGDVPEKYYYNEEDKPLITEHNFQSEEEVRQLIQFLFQYDKPVTELYRDAGCYVLDLSALRGQLIDFVKMDKLFSKWIADTQRNNTIDEYGMLLDFIGFTQNGNDKKNLLMVVRGS